MLSLFQFLNWIFLFLNTRYMFCESLYVLCPLFLWVGLMGGSTYVNAMHNILEMPELAKSEKEGAIVLCLIFNDMGTLLASIFTLVIDNTLFKTH